MFKKHGNSYDSRTTTSILLCIAVVLGALAGFHGNVWFLVAGLGFVVIGFWNHGAFGRSPASRNYEPVMNYEPSMNHEPKPKPEEPPVERFHVLPLIEFAKAGDWFKMLPGQAGWAEGMRFRLKEDSNTKSRMEKPKNSLLNWNTDGSRDYIEYFSPNGVLKGSGISLWRQKTDTSLVISNQTIYLPEVENMIGVKYEKLSDSDSKRLEAIYQKYQVNKNKYNAEEDARKAKLAEFLFEQNAENPRWFKDLPAVQLTLRMVLEMECFSNGVIPPETEKDQWVYNLRSESNEFAKLDSNLPVSQYSHQQLTRCEYVDGALVMERIKLVTI